mmetsp:Transcript_112707/g.352465  ORF Transcript_112707/g.352465 Transcript_112707/m.352465 type:complete len:88 (-) Transcript_112707:1873-2136(-)
MASLSPRMYKSITSFGCPHKRKYHTHNFGINIRRVICNMVPTNNKQATTKGPRKQSMTMPTGSQMAIVTEARTFINILLNVSFVLKT